MTVIESILVGLIILAIGGLIKAFADIQVLKREVQINKEQQQTHENNQSNVISEIFRTLHGIEEKLNILIGKNSK